MWGHSSDWDGIRRRYLNGTASHWLRRQLSGTTYRWVEWDKIPLIQHLSRTTSQWLRWHPTETAFQWDISVTETTSQWDDIPQRRRFRGRHPAESTSQWLRRHLNGTTSHRDDSPLRQHLRLHPDGTTSLHHFLPSTTDEGGTCFSPQQLCTRKTQNLRSRFAFRLTKQKTCTERYGLYILLPPPHTHTHTHTHTCWTERCE